MPSVDLALAGRLGQLDAEGPMRLRDRLTEHDGRFYFSGSQALVRLVLDQMRRDATAGTRTGAYVTGYPGPPLARLDIAFQREGSLMSEHGIVVAPAGSEERAVTALMGTQMLDLHPHERCDGVVGVFYGKGPGVDRSGDALRHANFAGTSKHGSVVVLSGEDHEAKSSTMPFQEEFAFMSAGIPVLYPSSVAEFYSLGLHAFALSRFSGCWIALKLVTPLCDGGQTMSLNSAAPTIVLPALEIDGAPFSKRADFTFFPGQNIDLERHLYRERHEAVFAYARANALDRVEVQSPGDRTAVMASGKNFADVRQALVDMGVDDADLRRAGVRLVKIGLLYPLDRAFARAAAAGVEQVIVVEEKRPVLEDQVRAALSGTSTRVLGKDDEHGHPLFPVEGALDPDRVAELLGPLLTPLLAGSGGVEARLDELRAIWAGRDAEEWLNRTPNYCSGCPHSLSTRLPEGAIAWGSPGCHSFASLMEQPERHVEAMTQYGGEGLPWIGLAPFTERAHMVQNVGDGSLFHSSYENIRSCVDAGVNITFKILFNQAVANTGAQRPVGGRSVAELCGLLDLEGVRRVALVTKQPRAYRRLPRTTTLHKPYEVVSVQRELAEMPGVTVLIYDESCANERRRRQRRGQLAPSQRFVVVNERLCEHCGDCGRASNCMSLQSVETAFGPKTQVNPSSCNQDESCLEGDCPSFVTIEAAPGTGYRRREPFSVGAGAIVAGAIAAGALPEPLHPASPVGTYRIYAPGVGGTGVITVNAILAVAASIDGLEVRTYDQTGAAQKWGPVVSSLVVAPSGSALHSNLVGRGQADLLLALDLVGAVGRDSLERCDPGRSAIVVNTDVFPTGEMVRDLDVRPDSEGMLASLERHGVGSATVRVPARTIATSLLGDDLFTNMVVVGSAYQAGHLPLSPSSIEQAIELNATEVERNLQAFRCGRLWVADPAVLSGALAQSASQWSGYGGTTLAEVGIALRRAGYEGSVGAAPATGDSAIGDSATGDSATRAEAAIVHGQGSAAPRGVAGRRLVSSKAARALLMEARALDPRVAEAVALRVGDLIGYQGPGYAGRYLERVRAVAAAEARLGNAKRAPLLTEAVARNLHHLMAYKDEYEVARLSLDGELDRRIAATFDRPVRVRYQLHPPLLRALGLQHKVALGPWFRGCFWVLRSMRRLRGTRADPFGYTRARRDERDLVKWYEALVDELVNTLSLEGYPLAVAVAETADAIRGYEHVKLSRSASARERAAVLMGQLRDCELPAGDEVPTGKTIRSAPKMMHR